MKTCEDYVSSMSVRHVNTQAGVASLPKYYADAEEIFLDFETSGLNAHVDTPWLLALCKRGSNTVHVIDVFMLSIDSLKETLERCVIVGANLQFDLKWLRRLGIRPRQVFDVITMGRMLTAGISIGYRKNFEPIPTPNDLASLCERYIGFKMEKGVRLEFIMHHQLVDVYRKRGCSPPWRDDQVRYAGIDVYVLADIMDSIQLEIDQKYLRKIAKIENRLVPVVADMEYEGVLVDAKMWMEIVEHAKVQMQDLYGKVCEYFKDSAAQTSMFPEVSGSKFCMNLESPQVVKAAFAKLGINIEDSKRRTLKLVYHPVAQLLLDYRAQQKQFSTYGEKWIAKINPITGRVHSHFNPLGAESGRFSSNDPNVQNVPDNKYNMYPFEDPQWANEKKLTFDPLLPEYSYRHCFKARPGYKLIIADYSQIELRIAAEISNDEAMLQIIEAGGDLHSRTAATMFNVSLEECGKGSEYRSAGKTLNFAILYGLGDRALAEALGFDVTTSEKVAKASVAKARKIKEKYFDAFPGIHAYVMAAQEDPFTRGYSETILGRRRWYTLPDTDVVPEGTARAIEASLKNQGKNSPIQGTSADMTKMAMVMVADHILFHNVPGYEVNCVHDELVVEVRDDQVEEMAVVVKDLMIQSGKAMLKIVPVDVEVNISDVWDKH